MKWNQLIIAAIFFGLGFVIAYYQTAGPQGSGGPVDEQTKIVLETPEPDQVVTSPLRVAGRARGTWFFEASFPVEIKTADGTVLATGIAQAQEDWMTEEFVAFEGKVIFDPGTATEGFVVFKKDNPSGLPENDDQVEIPVKF